MAEVVRVCAEGHRRGTPYCGLCAEQCDELCGICGHDLKQPGHTVH